MMEPPSFNSGRAFCTVNSAPFTLVLNSLSKCSSVMLQGGKLPSPAGEEQRQFAALPPRRFRKADSRSANLRRLLNASSIGSNGFHRLV